MGRVISLMADKDWLLGERRRLVRATVAPFDRRWIT